MSIEKLLDLLNQPLSAECIQGALKPQVHYLLLGPMRTGSTLLLQKAASSGNVAYPSNLISRFFSCPWYGQCVQDMLFDPEFRVADEFCDIPLKSFDLGFSSRLGKTRGTLNVNEFYYFWRNFIPDFYELKFKSRQERLDQIRNALFQLDMWSHFTGKSVALKFILGVDLSHLILAVNPNIKFVVCNRDRRDVVESILACREKYSGSVDQWYSVKQCGWSSTIRFSPERQVEWQVEKFYESISELVAQFPRNVLTIDFHELVSDNFSWVDLVSQ